MNDLDAIAELVIAISASNATQLKDACENLLPLLETIQPKVSDDVDKLTGDIVTALKN